MFLVSIAAVRISPNRNFAIESGAW
jgi:hypothetical protein